MDAGDHGYDSQGRQEVIPYIPDTARSVLDIGCANGAFGRALLQRRPEVTVDGIEASAERAVEASRIYREVIVGSFPDRAPTRSYDVIVCNDVLEHMVDPWTAVARLRTILRPQGAVVASIPNMRHWSALGPLLRGRWDYQSHGVLDRTHLRWFTKATMAELFTKADYTLQVLDKLSGSDPRGWWRVVRIARPALVDDLFTKQYVVVATL